MTTHLVITDSRPWAAVEETLAGYLPGLGVTLVKLDARRALLDGSVLKALRLQYGPSGAAAVLALAGIEQRKTVGHQAVQTLLDGRAPQADRPELSFAAAGAADWHLAMVKAPEAWTLLGGADQLDWGPLRIGQIDTGWTAHAALGFGSAKPWVAVAHGLTDFAPSMGDPFSVDGPGFGEDALSGAFAGHGTRTGGVICGRFDGAGRSYFGTAPRVPLVPCRIADHVVINHAQLQFARAVDHLVDVAKVDVINLSMGIQFAGIVKPLKRALNKAYDKGVIMVCAAGQVVTTVAAPARLSRTLAVAGVDRNQAPWTQSARGDAVDLSAPAVQVPVATTRRGGSMGYDVSNGTSFASAMVSAAAALWLLHRGAAIAARYPQPWQRVEAFTQLVRRTTQQPNGWQPQPFGTGILDVEALLKAPLPAAAALRPQAPA